MANAEKFVKTVSVFVIACCCVLLLPQTCSFIIEIGEKILGRQINYDNIMKKLFNDSLSVIFFLCIILLCLTKRIQTFFEKQILIERYGKNIFIFTSIGIIIASIIIRIIMYVKCRSLWADEAMLASSIVPRDWIELLVPPLVNNQSAPVLYVISVKAICLLLGYSEFSLRIFSFFSFIGLLICEIIFLKNVFNLKNHHVSFVVAMTALLPSYIWYSNELKPYMGDAFFVLLTLLLYFYYTKGRIKLPLLVVLYILVFGFSTPSIFFMGGVFVFEFIFAILNKNKKQIIFIFISGIIIISVFCLYFYWWMLPVMEFMDYFWNGSFNLLKSIKNILFIFSPGVTNSDSSIVMFFVPFAFLGIFSMIQNKDKMACSVTLSLFFVSFASAIGKWPLTGRLWLFLPAIVLIFTPIGIGFIHNKINYKKFTENVEVCILFVIIIYSMVLSLSYLGAKMYLPYQEINPLVYYVQKNIKEHEKLYVYPSAKHAFNFKNGYTTKKIGNVTTDNIIYGKNKDEWNGGFEGNELRSIIENDKVFLIFQHHWGDGADKGLDVLRNHGTLTEVMNVYDTPLYYFEKYIDDE